MCSHGTLMKLRGWTQTSFAIIWMSAHLLPPKKQSLRRSSRDHSESVRDEVTKFKQAGGAIKEGFYPKWLANTVVVKKKNGKWRVCVDFTDLNKACPKDSFPMPRINQLVDATVGHPQMSFLDVFQGYYQIPLARWSREDSFCHSYWKIPLQGDALWLEKCGVHLSKNDD